MTGILVLIGVAVGWAIAERRHRRLEADLWRLVKPEIANTAAPTTTELKPPRQVCPRCGSTHIEDNPDRFPPRRCLNCGDKWAGLYRSTRP